jgi:hypothetical protein
MKRIILLDETDCVEIQKFILAMYNQEFDQSLSDTLHKLYSETLPEKSGPESITVDQQLAIGKLADRFKKLNIYNGNETLHGCIMVSAFYDNSDGHMTIGIEKDGYTHS